MQSAAPRVVPQDCDDPLLESRKSPPDAKWWPSACFSTSHRPRLMWTLFGCPAETGPDGPRSAQQARAHQCSQPNFVGARYPCHRPSSRRDGVSRLPQAPHARLSVDEGVVESVKL